jgi:hypothetical protein
MSEKFVTGAAVTSRIIASLAARAALETPGVLRLESTLNDVLSRLHPAAMEPAPDPTDESGGCRRDSAWAKINGGVAHVHLEIATDMARAALAVSDAVRERVRQGIWNTGVEAGSIDISILAIESRPSQG